MATKKYIANILLTTSKAKSLKKKYGATIQIDSGTTTKNEMKEAMNFRVVVTNERILEMVKQDTGETHLWTEA